MGVDPDFDTIIVIGNHTYRQMNRLEIYLETIPRAVISMISSVGAFSVALFLIMDLFGPFPVALLPNKFPLNFLRLQRVNT